MRKVADDRRSPWIQKPLRLRRIPEETYQCVVAVDSYYNNK